MEDLWSSQKSITARSNRRAEVKSHNDEKVHILFNYPIDVGVTYVKWLFVDREKREHGGKTCGETGNATSRLASYRGLSLRVP
jgi:hypothetical protein